MTHKMPLTLAFNTENSYEDSNNTPYLILPQSRIFFLGEFLGDL